MFQSLSEISSFLCFRTVEACFFMLFHRLFTPFPSETGVTEPQMLLADSIYTTLYVEYTTAHQGGVMQPLFQTCPLNPN